LPVAFDFKGRLTFDEAEESAEFGFHSKGVLLRGNREAEGVGGFAQAGDSLVRMDSDNQPDGPFGRSDGE